MDKSKNPGIALERVHLLNCEVGDVKADVELAFALGITDLKRSLSADGNVLAVFIAFDLMKGVAHPPCKFRCSYLATYTKPSDSNMTWEEFKDHLAVAHLVPYVREFVSNITTRLPLSTLMLPPLNAFRLVKEYQQLTMPEVTD